VSETKSKPFFDIPYYHDYLSANLALKLLQQSIPVDGVPGLVILDPPSGLETKESLRFLCELYERVKEDLASVLDRRIQDRKFIDERVTVLSRRNTELNREICDPDYETIIGMQDANGRTVIGPLGDHYCKPGGKKVAPIPSFLAGPHVTLFGPPDSAKLAINAMNSIHRKITNEPEIVSELVEASQFDPMWGADDEDSKTPLHLDLVESGENLSKCFDRSLRLVDEKNGKEYQLEKSRLALPIKRFPGLGLPSSFLFFNGNPIPLHIYDFALHLYLHWSNAEALTFYVPKLENEEEARYINNLVSSAEKMIQKLNPTYSLGTVRLMVVLENPRAVLRTHEIIDALYPYFAGASLGWHDFLASTARLFKNDSHYRIPVKADPDIVIKHIKASHLMLSEAVGSRGGIKIGGMYGILPIDNDLTSESFQLTLAGYFKEVITQLRRDLNGFWVAHPDFVRIGIALVEAWKRKASGDSDSLNNLVRSLLNRRFADDVLDFLNKDDIEVLDRNSPSYDRVLIVANMKESDFVPNNDPEEIRYNVFQSLQYVTDWLSGNGCVALPAIIKGVPVRVMDDLATAERSRWEVWHEINHGRFSIDEFLKIVHEEFEFIRKDKSDDKKKVQVKWNNNSERWYPIAKHLVILLMTSPNPVEFASELLLPFTADIIRKSKDPLKEILSLEPEKYKLPSKTEKFQMAMDACASIRFASRVSECDFIDQKLVSEVIESFKIEEIIYAASFHGNIGDSIESLDNVAASEQKLLLNESEGIRNELKKLAWEYQDKFGFKFLISAKGKSSDEIKKVLLQRLTSNKAVEMNAATSALAEIAVKRLKPFLAQDLKKKVESLLNENSVVSASIAINREFLPNPSKYPSDFSIDSLDYGTDKPLFQIASLSKTIASSFALDYFSKNQISIDMPVNKFLEEYGSKFKLRRSADSSWSDRVVIRDLMQHVALNVHYVNGFPIEEKMPRVAEILEHPDTYSYEPIEVIADPGTKFHYSGGGFLLLEYLIELHSKLPVEKLLTSYLDELNLSDISFEPLKRIEEITPGADDHGDLIPGNWLQFPRFAAGAVASSVAVAQYLALLTRAYNCLDEGGIGHDFAVKMLNAVDKGSVEFMGARIGLGVFVAECGQNRFAIHQGANDGYRALYLQCFSGPDRGKGFVVLLSGENNGVLVVAEIAQILLEALEFEGINYSKFKRNFDPTSLKKEEIVNIGYKELVFDAFSPDLPEKITRRGQLHDFELEQSAFYGASILKVSNQKFARAENLISAFPPVFDPTAFGRQGKVMDSWETERHNRVPFDFVEIQTTQKIMPRFALVSTAFHDGNHAEFVSIEGWNEQDLQWSTILDKSPLLGHAVLRMDLGVNRFHAKFDRFRICNYPDGGISRVAVFESLPREIAKKYSVESATEISLRIADEIPHTLKPMSILFDPKSPKKGELRFKLVEASNEHYGPAFQVLSPYKPLNMFDGFESARSREKAHFEYLLLQAIDRGRIESIELDFSYFRNNNPKEIEILGKSNGRWKTIVDATNTKPYAGNRIRLNAKDFGIIDEIKLLIRPDGGLNRIKIYSIPSK